MKNLLYFVAGITGIAAYLLATRARIEAAKPLPVDELAHKLQGAWADHHTVA